MDFILTCAATYLGQPRQIFRFWWHWPNLQGYQDYIYNSAKKAYLYSIILTNGHSLTKLTQIQHWKTSSPNGQRLLTWEPALCLEHHNLGGSKAGYSEFETVIRNKFKHSRYYASSGYLQVLKRSG